MTYTFHKQVVAVIGSAGQVGSPLTQNLLSLGHAVIILSRRASDERLRPFHDLGAKIVVQEDLLNKEDLVKNLAGVETLICAVPASPSILSESEPLWLEAAVQAGVKRFVPTEFGAHTRSLDIGDGVLFDAKKKLHEKIFASGIGWSFFYNGGFFNYFLPNLRFFAKITTFGDKDLPVYTHELADVGRCAAMALTDDCTLNKCIQMDYNFMSQNEMLGQLKTNFPDYPFEYEHFSSEFITQQRNTASDKVSAKQGAETDRERWGINYVIYVLGKLHAFTDETVRCSVLYPDFKCDFVPEDALKDPKFVFES